MTRSTFRFLCSGVSAPLAALLIVGTPAPAQMRMVAPVRTAKANPPVVFAQTQSDIAVDPGARFGRLPNGMTYVIYKNKTPPGTASVWMRVAAGSVMEQEDQRGLAHFIEHMAFNGSTNVPEGEMVKLLQRDGLKFGADTNAQTQHFQTIYMLNLPDASDRILGDALFLMRETAGNISFNTDAIDRERGVVLGEERMRATVESRAAEEQQKLLFPGTKLPERIPIGSVDVVKTAARPAFLRFYNDFYRPEYTTLIVAGDVDPDKIEADIRRRFSDWQPAKASPDAHTDFGVLAARAAPVAKVFAADGLPDAISVSWVMPPHEMVETKAKDFDDSLSLLAIGILNERFARATREADCAFVAAGLQQQNVPHTARSYSLNIRPKDGKDRAAFDQAMAIFRTYLGSGPSQAELDRTVLRIDRSFEQRAAAARTKPTGAITREIAQTLGEQEVLQTPAQALEEFRAMKSAYTIAAVNTALKRIRPQDPPVLWRQGKDAASFDEAAMIAAYHAAIGAPVGAVTAHASAAWPYTQFGTPSAVAKRETLAVVDATRVAFANGVVLTVKQTKFEDNAVHVAIQLGDGDLGLGPEQGAPLFMAKQTALAGGFGKLASEDVGQALTGKAYGLRLAITGNATILSGTTTSADLATQMQVLAAFITDPGFRPEALDRVKAALPSSYDAARTSPDGVYGLKASGAPYGDDPRFVPPSLHDALAVRNDQIMALVKDQLGHGPVDVTIVGDITPDEAIRQVGATLGALPPLPAAIPVSGADHVHFPTGDLHRVFTHDGRADQNLSVIAWPTTGYYADPRRAVTLEVLAAVLTIRELEEVREKQGATYSASAQSTTSRYFPGFGFIISRATVRPEMDDGYFRTVSAIVDDLKRHPVTPDELNRARLPLVDRLHNERNGNGYWQALLSGTLRDPRQVTTALARESDLLSVTPEGLQAVATTYLDMARALRVQIKPHESAR